MLSVVKSFGKDDEYSVRTIYIDNEIYYKGKNIASILGYKDTACAISRHINKKDKSVLKDLLKKGCVTSKKDSIYYTKKEINNDLASYYINEIACKKLIIESALPKAYDVAKAFGINMFEKVESIEQSTLRKIMKSFSNEEMTDQKKCCGYAIDLYFTEYKLAVECDERGHTVYDENEEKIREKKIKKKLKCEFIRYNPDVDGFDVLDVISEIHKYIIKYIEENTLDD